MLTKHCVCDALERAKCCAVALANSYVEAATFGEDKDIDYDTLDLLIQLIDMADGYDFGSHVANSNNLLSLTGNRLPADTNCLSEDQLSSLLEQITIICNNCNCNC